MHTKTKHQFQQLIDTTKFKKHFVHRRMSRIYHPGVVLANLRILRVFLS